MASSRQSKTRSGGAQERSARNVSWYVLLLGFAVLATAVLWLVPVHVLSNREGWYDSSTWRRLFFAQVPSFNEAPLRADDYAGRARRILRATPLIDGHNDFPFLLRQQLHGKLYGHDFQKERLHGQTDFHKMQEGLMGGQFWSVYVPCPEDLVPGVDLNDPKKRVPDLNEPSVRRTSFSDMIRLYD